MPGGRGVEAVNGDLLGWGRGAELECGEEIQAFEAVPPGRRLHPGVIGEPRVVREVGQPKTMLAAHLFELAQSLFHPVVNQPILGGAGLGGPEGAVAQEPAEGRVRIICDRRPSSSAGT